MAGAADAYVTTSQSCIADKNPCIETEAIRHAFDVLILWDQHQSLPNGCYQADDLLAESGIQGLNKCINEHVESPYAHLLFLHFWVFIDPVGLPSFPNNGDIDVELFAYL